MATHTGCLISDIPQKYAHPLHNKVYSNSYYCPCESLPLSVSSDPGVETNKDRLTPLHFSARYIPLYRDEPDSAASKAIHHSSYMAMKFLAEDCTVDVNCKVLEVRSTDS